MWTTQTADPLGKLLFGKYRMHLLSRPREHVSVLDVFPVREGEALSPGGIDSFLGAPLDKPAVAEGEVVFDINATVSDAVEVKAGLSFLQGFLAWIGVGVMKGVSASVEKSKSRALRFRFDGCTRDYVRDGFDLDRKLSRHPFDRDESAMREGYRYYIATAVHFCKELTFEVLDQNLAKVNLEAEVMALGGGNAGLSVNNERQITARSDRTLAYGVELNELVYDEKRDRLRLQETTGYVPVRAGAGELPRATVVGPDEPRVLNIAG